MGSLTFLNNIKEKENKKIVCVRAENGREDVNQQTTEWKHRSETGGE